jgi:hypothetical protein
MDADERTRLTEIFDQRLAAQEIDFPGWTKAWRSFCPALLAHGGELVVPPPTPDILLEMQCEQGRVVEAAMSEVPGERSDCHLNAARLWRSGAAVSIGTGYALSSDGLWREHSWAWSADGTLLETTDPRDRYFGVRFDDTDAGWFADWQDPPG